MELWQANKYSFKGRKKNWSIQDYNVNKLKLGDHLLNNQNLYIGQLHM